jgi:hypothetical protein
MLANAEPSNLGPGVWVTLGVGLTSIAVAAVFLLCKCRKLCCLTTSDLHGRQDAGPHESTREADVELAQTGEEDGPVVNCTIRENDDSKMILCQGCLGSLSGAGHPLKVVVLPDDSLALAVPSPDARASQS